jgi:hypothetical protein
MQYAVQGPPEPLMRRRPLGLRYAMHTRSQTERAGLEVAGKTGEAQDTCPMRERMIGV